MSILDPRLPDPREKPGRRRGYELTFTNGDTGASMTTPSNGGASRTQSAADGSNTLEVLGHNVVFLFPTDVGGPSTTLYTGRAVITIDPSGTWSVVQERGKSIDICARLGAAG